MLREIELLSVLSKVKIGILMRVEYDWRYSGRFNEINENSFILFWIYGES